jgi:hypothetical protein
MQANEVRTQQNGRAGLDFFQRQFGFDMDQLAQARFRCPPQNATLEYAAGVGLEVLPGDDAALLLGEMGQAQRKVGQGNAAALGNDKVQERTERFADAPQDRQGQPVQQPHQCNH